MTDLQQKLLDLACEIDKICQTNHIPYYLVGGSLIGAIRHKGFIPWDDDLDVIMTRDNWYRFLEAAQGNLPEGVEIHSIDTDQNAGNTVNHFEDMKTTAIYRFNVSTLERSGILIDILILDPVPDNEQCKQLYVEKLTEYTDLVNLAYWYSIRVGHSVQFKENYRRMKKIGKERLLAELSKDIFSYKEEESQLYAQRLAGSPHFWPKEIFGTPKYVAFEDKMLPIPERAGDCLCIGYDDDWMYVPQGGVTKSTHDFCVMSLTVPAEYIMGEFEARVDPEQLEKEYAQKKAIQDSQAEERYQIVNDSAIFISEKLKLLYQKKSLDTNVRQLLEEKKFDELNIFFDEYTKVQCSSKFIGSSALAGWINWERKCHPLLIDIGDNCLAIAMHLYMHQKHLAWVGKLLKARHAIERPFTQELNAIETEYNAVKLARSHLECEEYDACYAILEQFQSQYPNNPFFSSIRLSMEVAQGASAATILPKIDLCLDHFPSDPEILVLKANALEEISKTEEAFQLYDQLIAQTTHGLVLQNVRERIEKRITIEPSREMYKRWLAVCKRVGEESLPSLDSLCPSESTNEETINCNCNSLSVADDPSLTPPHVLTPVQARRLQLLIEVAELCQRHNIRYYLFGKALYQAARNHEYTDLNGDLTVAMTPANCKKFIEVFEHAGLKDRYLDSMYNNSYFHRFCLRYGDENSLDFSVSQGANNRCGIYVTIEILRNPAKNKFRNLFDQMLEAGWESNLQMKWTSPKRWISYTVVSGLCTVFGRKHIGKWLYTRFMNGPKKKVGDRYYLKSYWGKRVYYPIYFFKYTCEINFEEHWFTTMKPYRNYLLQVFGKKWAQKPVSQTKGNDLARFADASISYKDYLQFLKQENINVAAIWKRRQKSDRKYAIINTLNTQTGRYWELMCACGERYRLWAKYLPKRTYLIELFKSNAIPILMKELKDYYDTATKYAKKGYGLCFDKKTFELLEYCLFATGQAKQAQKLRKAMSPKDLEDIKYDLIKPGGGYGMRQATQNDVPAILVYLKRYVTDCIYLYIDIKKYGIDNPNMTVWFDSDANGIKCVIMKYHTGLNIFAHDAQWDAKEIVRIAAEQHVLSIHGPKRMIEELAQLYPAETEIEYGEIYEFTNERQYEIDKAIELASVDDALEIAQLVVTDDGIGAHYEVENLAAQFKERMETQMGRNFVIRDQGKIIAHIASYAELDDIATISGLIVDKDFRNNIYGAAIEAHIAKVLRDEGFHVYSYVITRLRRKLLAALGNKKVAEYGKIILTSAHHG